MRFAIILLLALPALGQTAAPSIPRFDPDPNFLKLNYQLNLGEEDPGGRCQFQGYDRGAQSTPAAPLYPVPSTETPPRSFWNSIPPANSFANSARAFTD